MKKREWKALAKSRAQLATEAGNEASALRGHLFRLRACVAERVPDVGITFGGWVDHAIALIEGKVSS